MEIDFLPKVKFYHPDNNINWIVRKFEIIESNYDNFQLNDNYIPRPDVALVFNFKSIPTVLHPADIELKPLFISTIPIQPLHLSLRGEVNSFIAICNASVLSKLLKIKLANPIPLIEISDNKLLDLWNQLSLETNDYKRINIFSDYINDLIPEGYQPDCIDRIYNDILANSLRKSLEKIVENSCCSLSSLQRNFLKRTGISMKKMIRIARVHTIFEGMLKEKQFNYKEIFFESNYYDQPHFIKDFKEITGKSPMQFFKQNSELLKIISGMESQVQ